jgi:7-carboxy-7-deazaguanine synthase
MTIKKDIKNTDFEYNNPVSVNQIIATIQGEGVSLGQPSLLLRTNYCNLKCPFCDSKYTWDNKEQEIINSQEDIDDLLTSVYKKSNNFKYKNLLLTGGEPTLYFNNNHYKNLILNILLRFNTIKQIDIESNGLFNPYDISNFLNKINEFKYKITNLTISPKIDYKQVYTNIENLRSLQPTGKVNINIKLINFMDDEIDDILNYPEFKTLRNEYNIPFYLMPLTPSLDRPNFINEYINNCKKTINKCLETGIRYSPREHVWVYKQDINESGNLI